MIISANELLERLQLSERQDCIAVKHDSSSIMETICAFVNEPGLHGGYLLLGVEKAGEQCYTVCGVDDPDALIKDINNNCKTSFNRVVLVDTACKQLEGKAVVVVHAPEANPADKPIYFAHKPLPGNAWRYGTNGEYPCRERDLAELYEERDQATFAVATALQGSLEDLDLRAIEEYRRERSGSNPSAEELQYNDIDLLLFLNCVVRVKEKLVPTIAGIILFGTEAALRRLSPALRLDFI